MEFIYDHNKPGIYKITNITNQKCYIGSTMYLYGRFKDHKRNLNGNKNNPNKRFQAAWTKYGENNFIFEILELVDYIGDKKELKDTLIIKEQYWVNILNPEYNVNKRCVSSNLGSHWKLSGQTKIKMKQKRLRGREAYNAKRVVLLDINGDYIQTFDTCHQCSEYLRDYIKSAAMVVLCCKRQCNSIKNKYISLYEDDWNSIYKNNRQLLDDIIHKTTHTYRSQRQSKLLNTYYKTHIEIHQKQSQVQKCPVLQYDLKGNFIAEYDSIKGAWESLGISRSVIGDCCRGKRQTVGNFIFKFKNGGRKKKCNLIQN